MIDLSLIAPNTTAGKVVRLPLRLLSRKAVVRILQGPLCGRKWIVGSSLHRCWLGSYEMEFQKAVATVISRGGVFYDVGANVGFYTLLAADLIFPGKVFAFEPVAANVSYCRAHIELNHITNVTVCQLAVSDKCGEESFATEDTRAMGRLAVGGNITVPTLTLDQIIVTQIAPPPNYVKMDIEGAEVRALRGARRCFCEYKPLLFLATHGREIHKECCRILDSWNYQISIIGKQEADHAELIARSRV